MVIPPHRHQPEEVLKDGSATAGVFPFAGCAGALRHEVQGALETEVPPQELRATCATALASSYGGHGEHLEFQYGYQPL